MGKYSPLKEFLSTNAHDRIPMTFDEIEKVLGLKLPASKRYPAWWSNNPSNNPMTQEWLDAGYETESVNTSNGKLVFRRVLSHGAGASGGASSKGNRPHRHPLFGRLKGTLTIPPGVDLTEPADPGLADYLDQKYGAEARELK